MEWTPKQKAVIDARKSSLLVSAAAGSGKTAVLVERIIQLICDRDNPVDLDRLLVMTFTNAAAAQMRERIGQALEKKMEEEPDREHLQVQAALVHRAQITTIDSFCLSLIRDHFNLLDLDPAFRIGDEGELMLLKADVMEALLEDYYQKGDGVFGQFVETYATGKSDSGIEDYIMQVYTFSQSNPFPDQWFSECRRELMELEEGNIKETRWMQYLMKDAGGQLGELAEQLEGAIAICGLEGGPEGYIPVLTVEADMVRNMASSGDYEILQKRLQEASFGRLPAARGKDLDPEKKEYAKICRDRVKKAVGTLKELYGSQTTEEAAAHMLGSRDVALKLLELAEEFHFRYQESKREKNIVDFNDLEHEALKILICPKEECKGGYEYSAVADELARRYVEILVDEYQDSNEVQDALLKSLSAERFGRPDVFMVGDVKQSIYKFRLARPQLFMEKYESFEDYEEEPGSPSKGKKIELSQNFRSRASVLDSINQVFYQIMTKNLGNIQYSPKVALHPGACFKETEKKAGTPTEILLADTGAKVMGPADEELEEYTSREMEARMIAARIKELTDEEEGLWVWDKDREDYRPARYGDMVILLRSLGGWTDSFLNVLTQEGIPAFTESGTGYFDTIEVETVLAMLAVIDNPMQDIPLAAVLKSAIVGMDEEELAWLMAVRKQNPKKGQDRGLYGAVRLVLGEEGQEEAVPKEPSWREMASQAGMPEAVRESLSEKTAGFSLLLESLRRQAVYLPIHELIHRMYLQTGYYDYVSAMAAGEVRRANLDMLIEKAWSYEKTSYKGLFHFIRYIEKLKKYDTDFGEATGAGKSQEMVRIMSIHKSKGLEFPIVFVAGIGKPFNKQDVRGKLLIDGDLGIGTDYLDIETRVKTSTLKKNVLKRKMDLDNLGEELRVLYVAMTRAKEKLILTGTDRYLEKKLEKWSQKTWDTIQIPYTILSTAGSFLDWILMTEPKKSPLFKVEEISAEALTGQVLMRKIERRVSEEELNHMDLSRVYDEDMRAFLEEKLSYRYPYEEDISLHTKMSVSELKKRGQDIDDKNSLFQPVIPEFLKEDREKEGGKKTAGGAVRGSAYHRVLELLDFYRITEEEDIRLWLKEAEEKRMITQDIRHMVKTEKIWRFLRSELGQRMCRAQKEGRLYREQQFVIGIPAKDMALGESEELVLIQGVVDAWMEEEDGLVLVDYKTDQIGPGQEAVLARRYGIQLGYYKKALEQMRKKQVKETVIYSLSLEKALGV